MAKQIDPAFEALIQHGLKRLEDMANGVERRTKDAAAVVQELKEQLIGLAHFGGTFPQGLMEQTDVMAIGRMVFDERTTNHNDEMRLSAGYNQQMLYAVIGRGLKLEGNYDAIVILRKAVRR